MARAPATITDVAAAAGVSIRTVSRVLNDSPKVGNDTRLVCTSARRRSSSDPES